MEWRQAPQDWNIVASKFKSYPNVQSDLYGPDIVDLLDVLGRARNPTWVQFHALVEQVRPT